MSFNVMQIDKMIKPTILMLTLMFSAWVVFVNVRVRAWPVVEAKTTSPGLPMRRDSPGVNANLNYSIDGKEYSQRNFLLPQGSALPYNQEVPVGTALRLHFNPANPSEVFLAGFPPFEGFVQLVVAAVFFVLWLVPLKWFRAECA